MFSSMGAFQDCDNSISIRYRFDGNFFNLRRLKSKCKVQNGVLDEFFFADNMAKGYPTEEKMQKRYGSDSCDSYDLTTSITKTKVEYKQTPGKHHN